MCGLAFESRYQTGLMGLGLFAWLAAVARGRLASLTAVLLAPVRYHGAMADRQLWPMGASAAGLCRCQSAAGRGSAPVWPRAGAFAISICPAHCFCHHPGADGMMVCMWLRNPRHPGVGQPAIRAGACGDRAGSALPVSLAILTTSFPVLGFSPLLPLWRGISRAQLAQILGGKTVTAISARHVIFAVYPFGVRPHMPMARYLYRHGQGTVYSLAPPFQSYPRSARRGLKQNNAKYGRLDSFGRRRRVFDDADAAAGPAGRCPCQIVYSNSPTRFGFGQAGRTICSTILPPPPVPEVVAALLYSTREALATMRFRDLKQLFETLFHCEHLGVGGRQRRAGPGAVSEQVRDRRGRSAAFAGLIVSA